MCPLVRTGTRKGFVQKNERIRRELLEDLLHALTLTSQPSVLGRALDVLGKMGKDPLYGAYDSGSRRNGKPQLEHDLSNSHAASKYAFTAAVGAGQDKNASLVIKIHVIVDHAFADGCGRIAVFELHGHRGIV